MISFEEAWTLAEIGDVIEVSNGARQPNGAGIELRAWRSHNFSGPLVEKIEGAPRRLRIRDALNTTAVVSFDIPDDGAHTFALPERLDYAISVRLRDLAARRWQAQTSFAYDGVDGVAYGADTAGNLLAVMNALALAPVGATTQWKLGRGEHRIWTLPQLQAFAAALLAYQGACFAREGLIAAEIQNAATVEAALAVDIESGWPTIETPSPIGGDEGGGENPPP